LNTIEYEKDTFLSTWKIVVPVIMALAMLVFVNIQANKAKRKEEEV